MENENNTEMSEAEREERMESLSRLFVQMRSDAVNARKTSGIEDVWMSCEEAYLGIDDLNRSEFSKANWAKPTSMSGPVTTNDIRGSSKRSTVFIPLTRRYVDAASAKLAEIILPIDDKAFMIKPEPIPDGILEDKSPAIAESTGQPIMAPPQQPQQPGQPPQQGQQPQPPKPVTVADMEQAKHNAAADAAKKAEKRIYDWMVEANYPAEARKVIKDAARIGTGILKGPFPELRRNRAMTRETGAPSVVMQESLKPGIKWIDPWNFFPAEGCGESVHDGDYCIERDYLSERKLKQLRRNPIYMKDQIDKVIEEGPGKVYIESGNTSGKTEKKSYEIWYIYANIKRKDLELTQAVGLDAVDEDKSEIPAICMMVNDTVIGAVLNPMDSGVFPYRVKIWSRRIGSWTGVGVAEQGATPQKVVNAASRALMNNGGASSGVQIILDQVGIVPADNDWTITPNKIWYKTGESSAQNVGDAFRVFEIPSVQPQMQAIIQYGMAMMEEATGIPLVTQGHQGPSSPETFGQAQLQDNNSHTWLRSIGYSYDDEVTEPLVKDLYEWLLMDPEVPDDEKGQFTIDAKGSIAMVERAIQESTMMMLLGASGNPAFGLDPAKLMQLILRSKRFDPRDITLSDEDKEKQQQMQPPPPPQLAVAQIRAQTELKKTEMVLGQRAQEAQMDNQTAQFKTKVDTDRDLEYVRAQTARDQTTAEYNMQKLVIERELALLKYANDQRINLEQVKVQLTKASMSEQTKRELAQAQIALNQQENEKDRQTERHVASLAGAKPPEPIEFPGRAEPGKAFSQ